MSNFKKLGPAKKEMTGDNRKGKSIRTQVAALGLVALVVPTTLTAFSKPAEAAGWGLPFLGGIVAANILMRPPITVVPAYYNYPAPYYGYNPPYSAPNPYSYGSCDPGVQAAYCNYFAQADAQRAALLREPPPAPPEPAATSQPNPADMDSLNGSLTHLKGQLTDVQNQLTGVQNQATQLQDSLNSANHEITSAQQKADDAAAAAAAAGQNADTAIKNANDAKDTANNADGTANHADGTANHAYWWAFGSLFLSLAALTAAGLAWFRNRPPPAAAPAAEPQEPPSNNPGGNDGAGEPPNPAGHHEPPHLNMGPGGNGGGNEKLHNASATSEAPHIGPSAGTNTDAPLEWIRNPQSKFRHFDQQKYDALREFYGRYNLLDDERFDHNHERVRIITSYDAKTHEPICYIEERRDGLRVHTTSPDLKVNRAMTALALFRAEELYGTVSISEGTLAERHEAYRIAHHLRVPLDTSNSEAAEYMAKMRKDEATDPDTQREGEELRRTIKRRRPKPAANTEPAQRTTVAPTHVNADAIVTPPPRPSSPTSEIAGPEHPSHQDRRGRSAKRPRQPHWAHPCRGQQPKAA